MADVNYDFSVSTDFPNQKVDLSRLDEEIRSSEILTSLRAVTVAGDVCTAAFKDNLSAGDVTLLDGIVAAHTGESLPDSATSDEGNPVVSLETVQAGSVPLVALAGRITKSFNYSTHNFTDKSTWFSESARRVGVSLVRVGDRWVMPDIDIIDMYHGRVADEEGHREDQAIFNPGDPHQYVLSVYVDGVKQTEVPGFGCPLMPQSGDFAINYAHGIVVPTDVSAWDGKTITADYSIAGGSGYVLRPIDGRVLEISRSEVQFSKPFEYTTSVVLTAYGIVDYFAPHLSSANGGPVPAGTPIPVESTTWKTFDQMNDETMGSLPEIPEMGGTLRGITRPRHILQFNYPGTRRVFSSLGMFVRVHLEGDIPLGGERATATFYGVSLKDPGVATAISEFLG